MKRAALSLGSLSLGFILGRGDAAFAFLGVITAAATGFLIALILIATNLALRVSRAQR